MGLIKATCASLRNDIVEASTVCEEIKACAQVPYIHSAAYLLKGWTCRRGNLVWKAFYDFGLLEHTSHPVMMIVSVLATAKCIVADSRQLVSTMLSRLTMVILLNDNEYRHERGCVRKSPLKCICSDNFEHVEPGYLTNEHLWMIERWMGGS